MNYRHSYHAGNFADVLKHAVLALIIEHLKTKPAPFRVIDTHAGVGSYDLLGPEAGKTLEWQDGIGRLYGRPLPQAVADILAPYLNVVGEENGRGPLARYPGSPRIARRLMRHGDRLVANELHPEDHAMLARGFAGDAQTKVLCLDAWTALKALLPPKERRGVVLVDPPFEQPGEMKRLAGGLRDAARRFATGVIVLWYPIKDPRQVSQFRRDIADLGLPKLLIAELYVAGLESREGLAATGLAILNPPYTLDEKLSQLLPFFAEQLSVGVGAHSSLEWFKSTTAITR